MSKMCNVMHKLWNTAAASYLILNPIPCLYLAIYSLHSAFHIYQIPQSSIVKHIRIKMYCRGNDVGHFMHYALSVMNTSGRFNV